PVRMPYEFREWEEELEPQAASARLGGPPRKWTGIGVLDPPGPPKRPPGPLAALPSSFLIRFLAGMILVSLVLLILLRLFSR
ncbi:MAG: hypothetical protein WBH24_12370, partial [Candidatus Acidiferrum sp.]